MKTQRTGKRAEDLALTHLQQKGLTLLARNYACRLGEIDLIMQERLTIVFVEVRYRSNSHFGGALESVDWRKQAKLVKTATHYLQAKGQLTLCARIDVVALNRLDGAESSICWVKNAIES